METNFKRVSQKFLLKIPMMDQQIKKYFPIPTQTSQEDKIVILKINNLISSKIKNFIYIEIGSYLGGSLTPFLINNNCKKVISIDHRNQILDDERNENWSYEKITEIMMLKKLKSLNLNVSKLKMFNGDISHYKNKNKYDLAFIDGIHTDKNTFSDFLYVLDGFKKNSIIIFHDSVLIYKALILINEFLKKNKYTFKIIKFRNSGITGIFFGLYSKINFNKKIFPTEDFQKFCESARENLLIQQLNNRIDVKFKISLFFKNKFPYKFSIKSKKKNLV